MQRHGARDPGFHKILADYPRDCTMATSRGHCSSDNIRASVILKLRSRHASVRPSASARSTEANTIIVSCAIVYRRWLPKAFVSRCGPIPSPSSSSPVSTAVSSILPINDFNARVHQENFTSLSPPFPYFVFAFIP